MGRHGLFTFAALAFALFTLSSCGTRGLTPGEGFIPVEGGRVWYRIVGSGSRTPMLVLHGGPGASALYLKPLEALASDRPVVFYDQLGGGHSDRPSDSTLWRMDRFVDEVARVRQALGLKQVHLYGHSWGSMLAAEYMFTHPQGVRSVVLASPPLSMPQWKHDADSLLKTLPDSVQATIANHERAGTFGSPEYQGAMFQYYGLYLGRRQPWSPDVDTTFAQLNQSIYVYMQGPSEFTITGTLKDYDCTPRLHEITAPTLFTVGDHDEASPSSARAYQALVPGSELAIVEESGHLTMQDQPERYAQILREFFDRAERRGKR